MASPKAAVAGWVASDEPTGWKALLALAYRRDTLGRTILSARHYGPLRVQKPLYPEGSAICHSVVLHPPGGIVGGDALTLSVSLAAQSQALITTPGATKWYRSAGAEAASKIAVDLGAGALLEWMPREAILFNGAIGCAEMTISLGEDSVFAGWDITCFGRTASDALFRSGRYRQRGQIIKNGRMLWLEHGLYRGGDAMLESPVGLAGYPVMGTMLVAGKVVTDEVLDSCRDVASADAQHARWGVTRLPELLVARFLGTDAETAHQYFSTLWSVVRPWYAQRAAVTPRIWNT